MSQVPAATDHDNDRVDPARPLLELTGATVRFGEETALDGVDFRMFPGEVHSLMGENGAGKSTLIKAITGALAMESGVLRLDGQVVSFATPHAAQVAGISTVYQEIELLPNVSVAENIALGREPRRFGLIDWRGMRRDAAAALHGLGLDIDPASILGTHPVAVQQLVAIARAISTDVKVLVLDEPTSSLDLERGRRAVPRHPRAQEARRRHPVRLALPRPGLRDLRPGHRAARRTTRRGVPDQRSAAHRPGPEDAGAPGLQLTGPALAAGRPRVTDARSSARAASQPLRASPTPTSTSPRARCWAWPGCSAPVEPRWRAR